MNILKKILRGLAILIIAFFAFAFWYRHTYSMEFVATYEINDPLLEKSVLIATQGSEYKEELVKNVVDSIKSDEVYIRVIDVSGLDEHFGDQWNSIILIHTWEYSRPPESVESFFAANPDQKNMMVITTSGSGEEKMQGVDAVTGASRKNELAEQRTAILQFLRETADL